MIVADAVSAPRDGGRSFDLFRQTVPATLLRDGDEGEELLLGNGLRSIRMHIASGTLLAGPVRLVYRLEGIDRLETRLLALRRFAALQRQGRIVLSLFPRPTKVPRWMLLIRTLDALASDSGHRAVAVALFGAGRVSAEWDSPSEFLRSRTRRLITKARYLAAGGYRDLLSA